VIGLPHVPASALVGGCAPWKLLYDSYMTELAVSEARDHLAAVIDEARRSGEPAFITRRGRRIAVIVDAEAYERVVDAAEDVADRRELEAARTEDDYVPWDEVKADLGLV
jgi:antitoxin Phd